MGIYNKIVENLILVYDLENRKIMYNRYNKVIFWYCFKITSCNVKKNMVKLLK